MLEYTQIFPYPTNMRFIGRPGQTSSLGRRRDTRTTLTIVTGLSRGRFQTDGRPDDRTMAAGASVT
jgi:hypothetical protein